MTIGTHRGASCRWNRGPGETLFATTATPVPVAPPVSLRLRQVLSCSPAPLFAITDGGDASVLHVLVQLRLHSTSTRPPPVDQPHHTLVLRRSSMPGLRALSSPHARELLQRRLHLFGITRGLDINTSPTRPSETMHSYRLPSPAPGSARSPG